MGDRVKRLNNRPCIPTPRSVTTYSVAFEVTWSMQFEHTRSVLNMPEVKSILPF